MRFVFFWLSIFGMFGSHVLAEDALPSRDPRAALSYYERGHKLLVWDRGDPLQANNDQIIYKQMQLVLDDRLQTQEHQYLAISIYSQDVFINGNLKRLKGYCEQYPPRNDDYFYRNRCLYTGNMPTNERIEALRNLGEEAYRARPNELDGSIIFSMLGIHLTSLNRSNEGIRAFKRRFEMIPPQADKEIAEAKADLAFAYSNPMLSEKLRRLAIIYYKEVHEWYKLQEGSYYQEQASVSLYNLGIASLFLFQNYENAIEALSRTLTDPLLGTDSRVFLAFAYAKSGRVPEAHAMLRTIQLDANDDPERLKFLTCYRDLSWYLLGQKNSLKSCLQMNGPQADVLLHLTEVLSEMGLPAADENIWWRMFYRSFKVNLLPDIQNAIDSASSEAELVNLQAESRLKDLKLENMSLYKYLLGALTGLTVLLGIAGFLTWKARRGVQKHARAMNIERARLQNILDSIEEGIFVIQPDLVMVAEPSVHLRNILGPHYRERMELSQLLSLSDLEPDVLSTQIACIKASMEEDSLVWDLNHGNLVTDFGLGDKYLALFWQPIFQDNRLQSIFLALRDVTAVQILKKANAQAQEDADKVLVYVREITKGHSVAVVKFLGDLPSQLQGLEREINQGRYDVSMRLTHTIKGTARSLGLSDLRESAHHVEDQMQKKDAAATLQAFSLLQSVARLYLSAQHFVKEDGAALTTDSFQIVSELRAGVEQHLQASGLRLKELHVKESGRLSPAEYEKVREILLHGLTNAADHGFIIPHQNGLRVSAPEIAVEIVADDRCRNLLIRDNGVGLQRERLQSLAEARGWRPQADENWSDFLFTDGITTAAAVTISSGRGVGLAAVKELALSLKGEVHLRDNDVSSGAILHVSWNSPLAQDEPRMKPSA